MYDDGGVCIYQGGVVVVGIVLVVYVGDGFLLCFGVGEFVVGFQFGEVGYGGIGYFGYVFQVVLVFGDLQVMGLVSVLDGEEQ